MLHIFMQVPIVVIFWTLIIIIFLPKWLCYILNIVQCKQNNSRLCYEERVSSAALKFLFETVYVVILDSVD